MRTRVSRAKLCHFVTSSSCHYLLHAAFLVIPYLLIDPESRNSLMASEKKDALFVSNTLIAAIPKEEAKFTTLHASNHCSHQKLHQLHKICESSRLSKRRRLISSPLDPSIRRRPSNLALGWSSASRSSAISGTRSRMRRRTLRPSQQICMFSQACSRK